MGIITEYDHDDGVCKVETVGESGEVCIHVSNGETREVVMKTCDVEEVNRSESMELLLENTEAVAADVVELQLIEMILELIEDDKNSLILSPEDEIHKKWESILVHSEAFHAKNLELMAAKELVTSKKQEIDHVQGVLNKLKNAIAVEDIDSRISKAEHVIEHGTLCLDDERQLIREIKQLKSMRVQLASNIDSSDVIKHALDQKDQIEELLKSLNMELKTFEDEVSKAQEASHTVRKKYLEELEIERELRAQCLAANESYKEASVYLHSLKKGFNDKVEIIMDIWNRNEELRKDYINWCNMLSAENTQDEPSCLFMHIMDPFPQFTNSEAQETVKSVEEQRSVEHMMKNKEPITATEIIEIKENEETKVETEAKLKEKAWLEERMKLTKRRLKRLKKKEKKRAARYAAVAVAIRNKKPLRHWGSMVITVVVLILSMFSLVHSSR